MIQSWKSTPVSPQRAGYGGPETERTYLVLEVKGWGGDAERLPGGRRWYLSQDLDLAVLGRRQRVS